MKQWKKSICFVMALMMLVLSGCQSSDDGKSRGKDRDDEEQMQKQGLSVEFEYYEIDGSWYDRNGNVLVSHVYRAVEVLDHTEAADKINSAIENDGSAFIADQTYHIYESEEEMAEYLELAGMGYGDLFYDVSSEVTHNGDGIISIRMGIDWFMGGVFNADYYGMTFDLTTGEKLNVLQLIGGDPVEAEERLNTIICDYVNEAYGESLLDAPERILADYSAEGYDFYVEEGQIMVTFSTYTFASGAAGATVVPTGIMIGE